MSSNPIFVKVYLFNTLYKRDETRGDFHIRMYYIHKLVHVLEQTL